MAQRPDCDFLKVDHVLVAVILQSDIALVRSAPAVRFVGLLLVRYGLAFCVVGHLDTSRPCTPCRSGTRSTMSNPPGPPCSQRVMSLPSKSSFPSPDCAPAGEAVSAKRAKERTEKRSMISPPTRSDAEPIVHERNQQSSAKGAPTSRRSEWPMNADPRSVDPRAAPGYSDRGRGRRPAGPPFRSAGCAAKRS